LADRSRSRVAVIGLGRFGSSLLLALEQREVPVIGIDRDADVVQSLSEQVRNIVVADGTTTEALEQLDIGPRTRAVIAVAGIQSSLLTMTSLAELGVPEVWAKASSPTHAKILRRLGAQHVVQPEREMGFRMSHLLAGQMMDYLEFDDDFAFAKTTVPAFAVGLPLGESAIRTGYGITVVAVKRPGEKVEYATAETVPRAGDTLIISGVTSELERFSRVT
jgi:trk system potassium uptake protein TrkA